MDPLHSPAAAPDAIHRLVVDLLCEGNRSALLLLHGECAALDPVLACRSTPEAALRDLELRCVLPSWVRTHPAAVEWRARLESTAASVRFLPSVPQSIMVIDRDTALVAQPRPARDGQHGVSIVEGPDLVEAIGSFCEFLWEKAEPAHRGDAGIGLSHQELGVLRLLAEGHTDQVIARRIGVSVRTAGRLSATLMSRLDARSRFQAGARAVQLGLLPLRAEPAGRRCPARRRTAARHWAS